MSRATDPNIKDPNIKELLQHASDCRCSDCIGASDIPPGPVKLAAQEVTQGENDSSLPEASEGPKTAAQKIMQTLRDLSDPDPDAGGLELTLATVAMGLEKSLAGEIQAKQETGELDVFVLALAQFLATHRSDTAHRVIVVELPSARDLPTATKLHYLDKAIAESEIAKSPL